MEETREDSSERGETPAERIDRNWGELLQELRVTQTGLQILAGFLLTMPFQSGFDRLSHGERVWYGVTLAAALGASAFVLTPVITHRLVFRRHAQQGLLRTSDVAAKLGFVLLAVTLISAFGLVYHLVFGGSAGVQATVAIAALILVLWLAVPLWLRARGREVYGEPRDP